MAIGQAKGIEEDVVNLSNLGRFDTASCNGGISQGWHSTGSQRMKINLEQETDISTDSIWDFFIMEGVRDMSYGCDEQDEGAAENAFRCLARYITS